MGPVFTAVLGFHKLYSRALLSSASARLSAQAAGTHLKGEKPLSIAQGAQVELADFLVTGKVTVFDFTSEYCAPCRAYDDLLLKLHEQRPGIAVVKVDINRSVIHRIDWDSPVAQQYGIHSIPHFKIFGPDGKLVAEDSANNPRARNMVNQWINSLR